MTSSDCPNCGHNTEVNPFDIDWTTLSAVESLCEGITFNHSKIIETRECKKCKTVYKAEITF